jgi:flagellar basal-body rod protein FlgB
MLISDLFKGGDLQALELTAKFAGARQRTIASNIANISTPNYVQMDLSPQEFQKALRAAVERRREGGSSELKLGSSSQIAQDSRGRVTFTPTSPSGNILMHDRNDRDLERLMQANAENAGVFRVAVDLLRSRYEIMRSAIAERA